jgi:hypothetical protein
VQRIPRELSDPAILVRRCHVRFDNTEEMTVEHVLLVVSDKPEHDSPSAERRRDLDAWLERVSGVRRFGARLRPPSDAVVVRRRNGELIVSDGPFVEGTEWIGGFDVLDVETTADAIAAAAEHPTAAYGRIEVRAAWPFTEAE